VSEEAQAIILGAEVAMTIIGGIQSAIAAAEKAKDETTIIAIYRDALVAVGKQMNDLMQAESSHMEMPP
jgi:hypothetical protein